MTNSQTEPVTEARRMAMRTIEDWDYLSDEEKHGTLSEIVSKLAESEAEGER